MTVKHKNSTTDTATLRHYNLECAEEDAVVRVHMNVASSGDPNHLFGA